MSGPSETNPRQMMTGINNVGEGWRPLVRELEAKLLEIDPDYELLQVKEKFGGLRYYAHTRTESRRFHELINQAEDKSFAICEDCGTTENVRTSGSSVSPWLKTLCDSCRAKYEEARE